ncbi:MAG: phenylalanine--tRNA ligase subunit beta [Candidatus Dadabacteria bacterium]|nr:MAG: phenylalanine--tRNA ligase subunit beta [Candidatus Dadabacteria bacterium]
MKISFNWLKDYVSIPGTVSPQKLAEDITMSTVEVEDVEDIGARFDKMLVGYVESVSKHPNADRLKIASVDTGASEKAEIVCGGINLREGMWVAVAEVGAMLKVHGQGELVALKPAKIRGVVSNGMICASEEIGLEDLFPASQEAEIIDLESAITADSLRPGMPLATALGLDDYLLVIDNKSLTNRPDLWGHYGMAREVSALYATELRPALEKSFNIESAADFPVTIENTARSFRYIGALIEGSNPAESSPFWMQARLWLLEQRPISLLVDLTNYVLFSIGQPMHVFDCDKLKGECIKVRSASAGEKIKLLDDQVYELGSDDLVIADSSNPVALAGIMGGAETAVTGSTRRVLLESASFEPIGIRRSAARLGLRSESSVRFEKGIDSARAELATHLFLSLLKEIQPEIKVTAFNDCYPVKAEEVRVSVTRDFIVSRSGHDFTTDEIKEKLSLLGFSVNAENDHFDIVVPSWRATGDISIPEDIVEEVARLYGYENLEFVPPPVRLTEAVYQPWQLIQLKARRYLAYSAGLHEVNNYPWVEESDLKAAGIDPESCLKLHAPPSKTSASLRPSLVPALISAAQRNLRYFKEFGLFELGEVFLNALEESKTPAGEKLPLQHRHLACVCVAQDSRTAYLRARGALEGLLEILPYKDLKIGSTCERPTWGVSDTSFSVDFKGKQIGVIALASDLSLRRAGIEGASVALFELKLEALKDAGVVDIVTYSPLPRFPVVEFDFAMLFDIKTRWEDIKNVAARNQKLVQDVQFVDEYRGKQVPEGKKSIAVRLILANPNKTLTSSEIQKTSERVIKTLEKELSGQMRSV